MDQINRGESYIPDISRDALAAVSSRYVASGTLSATSEYSALDSADAVIVCVPSPLSKTKDPDLSYIVAATDEVANRLRPGMLVVLESTTYPGTTEEVILPRLRQSNGNKFHPGQDFFLAFSPERIDPGRTDWTISNTPKVIGGSTPACLEVARMLYETIVETIVPVSSPKEAEMVKLLENTFRATNIALVNEVAIMCDRLGVDVWEVIDAAKTKPFGFMPFYPGPGLGGHCIPVDPQYLAWKLRTLNYNARFVQLAEEINLGMPGYVVDKVSNALNEKGKMLKGSQVLTLGVAYKADVTDYRESPALDVIDLLLEKGVVARYHDPYVPHVEMETLSLSSVELDAHNLEEADCVIIATAHSNYDWNWVLEHSSLVVDTRNATAGLDPVHCRVVGL